MKIFKGKNAWIAWTVVGLIVIAAGWWGYNQWKLAHPAAPPPPPPAGENLPDDPTGDAGLIAGNIAGKQ
jgi:hypothetical protein